MIKRMILLVVIGCLLFSAKVAQAQKPFSDLIGQVNVQLVQTSETTNIPFITWGGDVATFLANGHSVKFSSDKD